jgi:anti-anti-sigma factor
MLSVSGEIDLATAPQLTDAVDAALGNGARELWIDLTDTAFMDSSGLHALLAARRRAHELNRRLAVICPGGPVRRLFDVAGVADKLPVYADRAAAHRGA